MSIAKNINWLLFSFLSINSPSLLASGLDFETAVIRANGRADHVLIVQIIAGTAVGGTDFNCGNFYEGVVIEQLRGRKLKRSIKFFSENGLEISSRYVAFLNESEPYVLPEGSYSIDERIKERASICKNLSNSGLPNLTTGQNPVLLKIVSIVGNADKWVDVDALRFRVGDSLTSRSEDIKHCEGDQSSLQPKECLLISRRPLVSLNSIKAIIRQE